jgi:hypothetical protein
MDASSLLVEVAIEVENDILGTADPTTSGSTASSQRHPKVRLRAALS